MVFVEVISVDGLAPESPLEASFDVAGGTIGRGPTNALVLPDPARTVSRVHAQLLRRAGVVKILARGTNDLFVDGQHVDMGDEVPLNDGARLQMGTYVLKASLSRMAGSR